MHKNTQVEDFIRWIDGAQPKTGFSLLRIATNVGKGGRGLVSQVPIPANSCCLSIPIEDPRLILTPIRCVEYIQRCGCFVKPSKQTLEPLDCLVLFLYHASLTTTCPLYSIWQSYFHALPRAYSDPIFGSLLYPKHCPTAFDSADLNAHFNRVLERLHKSWHQVRKMIPSSSSHQEFPPAKFVWAWCSINSRCVYCPLTSFDQERPERFTKHLEINTDTPCSDRWLEMTSHGTSDVALIPFFDFLNHNPGVTCRLVVNTPERMVQLFVDQPISAGEQVFINYGSHDNLTLLLEYGFSLSMDENPNDAVYPSSADLECVLSISDDNRLDRIVSFLDLTGMVTHGALRIWSTVCFTRTGPSLHLLLLLHLNTVIENANCLDDVLSQMDRNKLYEMDEDMLSQCLRPFLLRLLTRLQQQQDVDYQRVLNKRQHLPCHSLSASDCLQALEQFLVSRKELLQRIELVMSQVSSCLE